MSTRFNRLGPGVWITLVVLAVFSLSVTMAARQHQPPPPVIDSTVDQPNAHVEGELPAKSTEGEIQARQKPEPDTKTAIPCGETLAEAATGTPRTEVIYRLQKMLHHPDDYLGKTITVDGEMHRQFTDRVFTIQESGSGSDLLVISVVPMSESVIPLEQSFETHKQVRVTGVLRPYDRGKLECLFGPLNLESREGHSFTRNPVLIIGYKPAPKPATAKVEEPPIELEKPAAAPPPEPAKEEVAKEEVAELAVVEEAPAPAPEPAPEVKLPKTASNLPFVALAGVFFLFVAGSVRFFGRRGEARSK